jgi:glycerol-3-phosphate dehydrogenase
MPQIMAEVVYCVRNEMALTIEDMLARRIGMQMFSWRASIHAAPAVGALMAELLGWSAEETSRAIDEYVQNITRRMTTIGLKP